MRDALIVFAKLPAAGRVKTRLTPELSEQEAADLYEAFLLDALESYLTLDVDVRLYFAPSAAKLDFAFIGEGVDVFDQRGDDLGTRMASAFNDTFAAGYDRVAIIGTDHPTLPRSFIDDAFSSLSRPKSVTIGPAEDGGYYLLAMNGFIPEIFRGVTYSHANVFSEARDRIAASGASLTVLPEWYDVDTPAQLRRLCADIAKIGDIAPRTTNYIRHLSELHPWLER